MNTSLTKLSNLAFLKIGILKFVTKGSSNFILVNVVLGLLFVGFIAIGFWSLKYSKKIKSNASIENEATDTIINWLNDNVTKEDIEGGCPGTFR